MRLLLEGACSGGSQLGVSPVRPTDGTSKYSSRVFVSILQVSDSSSSSDRMQRFLLALYHACTFFALAASRRRWLRVLVLLPGAVAMVVGRVWSLSSVVVVVVVVVVVAVEAVVAVVEERAWRPCGGVRLPEHCLLFPCCLLFQWLVGCLAGAHTLIFSRSSTRVSVAVTNWSHWSPESCLSRR